MMGRSSNPRLQRTRLRAPLSRKPLGPFRPVSKGARMTWMTRLLLGALAVWPVSCATTGRPVGEQDWIDIRTTVLMQVMSTAARPAEYYAVALSSRDGLRDPSPSVVMRLRAVTTLPVIPWSELFGPNGYNRDTRAGTTLIIGDAPVPSVAGDLSVM